MIRTMAMESCRLASIVSQGHGPQGAHRGLVFTLGQLQVAPAVVEADYSLSDTHSNARGCMPTFIAERSGRPARGDAPVARKSALMAFLGVLYCSLR
jgi:hypothetical protein